MNIYTLEIYPLYSTLNMYLFGGFVRPCVCFGSLVLGTTVLVPLQWVVKLKMGPQLIEKRSSVQMRRVILIRPCVCFGSMVILVQYLFGGGCVDDVYTSLLVSVGR